MCTQAFDVSALSRGAKVLCLGKRGAGKTVMTKHILASTGRPATLIVSPVRDRGFTSFDGYDCVTRDPSPAVLECRRSGVIVLDDCLFGRNDRAGPAVSELMSDPQTTVIESQQFASTDSAGFDHIFIFSHASWDKGLDHIWSVFRGHTLFERFGSLEAFKNAVHEHAPNRYDCMVLTADGAFTCRAPDPLAP